jgi:putative sugar O-methyltransferase
MQHRIDSDLLHRFDEYKRYLTQSNHKYGKFWTKEGSTFDVQLKKSGYINKGYRNYLPTIYQDQKNLQDVNNFEAPFGNIYSIKDDYKYLTINNKKFCQLLPSQGVKGANQTLRLSKYWDEIIGATIPKLKKNIVLEVGPGAGLFSALMSERFDCKIVIIDIPYVIQNSIALFMTTYPNKTLLLPNEITSKTNIYEYDVIFLNPDQMNLIKNESIGLIVNTQSFMEMDYNEVENYFRFVNIKLVNNGYFFISNRIRKFTSFFSYPWSLLSQFKRLYLSRNKVFLRHIRKTTLIDCLLVKDSNLPISTQVFNPIYKFYLSIILMTKEERFPPVFSKINLIFKRIVKQN